VSQEDDILIGAKWYHKIYLPGSITTPGNDWDYLWDNIRQARKHVEYTGKKVLDLGSMEGMWAFEAEKQFASMVVTVDRNSSCMEKLLFCRNKLKSAVIPLFNVPIEDLANRTLEYHPFDIIQHLGLFYHLTDPLSSLITSRKLITKGGFLILETAAEKNIKTSCLVFNGVKPADYNSSDTNYWWRMYDCGHPQWMPTISCIKEMLLISGFIPIKESISIVDQPETHAINADAPEACYQRCRIALVAKAVDSDDITAEIVQSCLNEK